MKGLVLGVLIAVLSGLIIGCTDSSSTTSQTTATSKPVELSLNLTFPEVVPLASVIKDWAANVNERTNGEVTIRIYYSCSLLKINEVFRGVQEGTSDMANYVVGMDPGMTPLNEFTRLPFLGWPDWKKASVIYGNLLEEFPEMQAEWSGLKVYGTYFMPPYQIHTVDKIVRVPDDTKNLKLLAQSELAQVMAATGASPIDQPITEWYMSLERGVAEGCVTHFQIPVVYSFLELIPCHTILGENGISINPQTIIINSDSWNRLTPKQQQVFIDLEAELSEGLTASDAGAIEIAMKRAEEEMGHTIIAVTDDELNLWKELGEPIIEKWVTSNGAKGKPAREILEEARRLMQ